MISILFSIIGTTIALISFYISFFNFRKDKPILKLYYDIMCNTDRSKECIRLFYVNVGRRPTCIKSIGYFDWTLGSYLSKGGDKYEVILKEGEFGFYDIEMDSRYHWTIKTLYVEDYFGNKWELSEKKMAFLYRSAHNMKSNRKIRSDQEFTNRRKKSLDKYLLFIRKNSFENNDPIVKNYIDKGQI